MTILEIVVYLIVGACGLIFIINEKSDVFQGKYGFIVDIAKVAVKSAENLAEENGWTGPEKFRYVYNILKEYAKNLNEAEIQAVIESAVYDLNKEK